MGDRKKSFKEGRSTFNTEGYRTTAFGRNIVFTGPSGEHIHSLQTDVAQDPSVVNTLHGMMVDLHKAGADLSAFVPKGSSAIERVQQPAEVSKSSSTPATDGKEDRSYAYDHLGNNPVDAPYLGQDDDRR